VTGPSDQTTACDQALARAFGFLGKRWNGILIGTLANGPAGFAQLERAVGGISASVLSERLGELGSAGLVVRSVEDGPPLAVTYALTDRGRALVPALVEIGRWADEHLPAVDERLPLSDASACVSE
jgi:DNA-binding HxlR family transcriptional regulator